MSVLFSTNCFTQGDEFGTAKLVMMNEQLMQRYRCADICRFAVCVLCSKEEAFEFRWESGQNWGESTQKVAVATHYVQDEKTRTSLRIRFVFTARSAGTTGTRVKYLLFELFKPEPKGSDLSMQESLT